MSKEVKRYDCTDGGAQFCQGCYTMSECEFGEYVSWDDYDALLAERDAAQKDAERYRWLRDIAGNRILNELARDCTMDGWDAKIDAAMQGEQL